MVQQDLPKSSQQSSNMFSSSIFTRKVSSYSSSSGPSLQSEEESSKLSRQPTSRRRTLPKPTPEALWRRLPTELRQEIALKLLSPYLELPISDLKKYRHDFSHQLRTLFALEERHSSALLWPLEKFLEQLKAVATTTSEDLDTATRELNDVWTEWSQYTFTPAPLQLQGVAQHKEAVKYRTYKRQRHVERLQKIVLYSIRKLRPLEAGEKAVYRQLRWKQFLPDWKPVLVRVEPGTKLMLAS